MESIGQEVLALGLWLPCDQAHFFDSIKDIDLIPSNFDEAPLLTLRTKVGRNFQSSVFRRLYEVLGRWGYDLVLPLYPLSRIPYIHKTDPDAAIFYSRKGPYSTTISKSKSYLENLTLIVNSQGFYLWIVPGLDREYYDTAQDHLADHIVEVFGGSYYSRFSGLQSEKNRAISALGKEECAHSVREYLADGLGILAFFQLNTILEGLYNYSLDPIVFFTPSSDVQTEVSAKRSEYNVGRFIASIREEVHGITATSIRQLTDPHRLVSGRPRDEALIEIRELTELALSPESQSELLRKFIRSTANVVLQNLNLTVEWCRRALLHNMLGVTHRHQPLIQIDLPDTTDHQVISNVSEAQLRGYIMLAGAKLPLISGVRYYLEAVTERLEDDLNAEVAQLEEDLKENNHEREQTRQKLYQAQEAHQDTKRLIHGWVSLLDKLEYNISRLEQAIEQASADKMVFEEEQIRAEQEMLGELELLRQRRADADSGDGDSPGLVEAVVAVGALIPGIPIINRIFSTYSANLWNFLWLVPLYLLIFLIIYII
jgi:hypothetical protein